MCVFDLCHFTSLKRGNGAVQIRVGLELSELLKCCNAVFEKFYSNFSGIIPRQQTFAFLHCSIVKELQCRF